jgi:hypothetical protein
VRPATFFACAGTLVVTFAGPAAADRLLMEAPGLTATLDQPLQCDKPASVTIEAAQPDLFGTQSPELQRLVDALHAMLAFECPGLPEIQVRGVLKGLREPVYRATAAPQENWALRVERTVRAEVPSAPETAGPAPEAEGSPGAESAAYTVAGLSPGMTVEEAGAAVADTFGVRPEYDAQNGLMTMYADGCPQGYPSNERQLAPRAGWKCLRAWFTDQPVPKLYLVELTQVVGGRRTDAVEHALTERYGEPVQGARAAPARENALYLSWGDTVDTGIALPPGAPRPSHVLEAAVEPVDDVIVTTVTLYGPGLATHRGRSRPPGGLDLKF